MKKTLSLLLSFIVLAVSLNLFALAADAPTSGTCGENVSWTFDPDNGILTLSGSGVVDEFQIGKLQFISDETGQPYTDDFRLPPWNAWRDQITEVEISEGITILPQNAFSYLPSLKTAKLADSITDLGFRCFQGCRALEAVNLPSSLTTMSDTFLDCKNLNQVMVLPESIKIVSSPFMATGVTTVVLPGTMKAIGSTSFLFADNLNTVLVGNGIESIGDNAFKSAGIKTLLLPASVKTLGSEMCWGCKSLSYVYLPDGIKTIPSNVFGVCTALKSIRLPGDLETIEQYAFNNCNQMTSISLPATLTAIGDGAFNFCDALTDIYYQGTEEQWNAIEISDVYNAPLQKATIHFNAEGDANAFLPGDVNGDGVVTAEDARLTLRTAVNLEQFENGSLTAICCDYNLDGFVTAEDARMVLRTAVGLENE